MAQAPARTNDMLFRGLNDTADPAELVSWAVQALVDGFDTPSLRRLAGIDLWVRPHELSIFESVEEFRGALRELGMAIPSPEEILRRHAQTLAEDICAGRLEPQVAVDHIHSEVLNPLNHPTDLMDWCFLWGGRDPMTRHELSNPDLDKAIRAAAERLRDESPRRKRHCRRATKTEGQSPL